MKYSLSQKQRAKEARHDAEKLMPMTREDVDAEILPLRAKVGNLQTEVDRKDASLDRAKQAKERDDELLAKLAKKLEDAASEKKGIEATLNDLQSKLADKQSELKTVSSDLLNLEGLFAALSVQSEEEIAALKAKIEQLEQSLAIANQLSVKHQKGSNKNSRATSLSGTFAQVNRLSDGLTLSNTGHTAMDYVKEIQNSVLADLPSHSKAIELGRQAVEKIQSDSQTAEAIAAARQAFAASQLETDN